jgi:hypothetical protein
MSNRSEHTMTSLMNVAVSSEHIADLTRAADRRRAARGVAAVERIADVAVRMAGLDDAPALRRLAALDDARGLEGRVLLALVG